MLWVTVALWLSWNTQTKPVGCGGGVGGGSTQATQPTQQLSWLVGSRDGGPPWPSPTLLLDLGRFLWCQVQLWHRGTCFDLHDLLLLRKCWALQIMNHNENFDQAYRKRKKTFLAVMCWFEIGCEHWVLVRDNGDCTGGHLVEPSYLLLDKTSEGEHTTFIPTVIKLLILWSRACGDMYNEWFCQIFLYQVLYILEHSKIFLCSNNNDILDIADWSKERKPSDKNEWMRLNWGPWRDAHHSWGPGNIISRMSAVTFVLPEMLWGRHFAKDLMLGRRTKWPRSSSPLPAWCGQCLSSS